MYTPAASALAISGDSHAKRDVRNCRGDSYCSITRLTSEVISGWAAPRARSRAFSNKTIAPLHTHAG
jgi:hypothetical protein